MGFGIFLGLKVGAGGGGMRPGRFLWVECL